MSQSRIERRLVDVNKRLQRARDELAVLDQQVVAFADEADETRVRALVSDSPQAAKDYREAEKHADAMRRSRSALTTTIAELERAQDELLDRLVTESR
jgi:predicted ABC-type transport system involved in lysophospholipase L1 biosynthesis ATPase subunit